MNTPRFLTFSSSEVRSKAAENIADLIIEKLGERHSLLVFLSGGSAIEMYRELFQRLQNQLKGPTVELAVALVDERYGLYGHPESNEQQLKEKGVLEIVKQVGASFTGILSEKNETPQKTLAQANQNYQKLMSKSTYKLLLLGLGEDGHTAGWLSTRSDQQFQKLYTQPQPIVYYQADAADTDNPHLQRFTISASLIPKFDQVIIYTKGENKKKAVAHLMTHDTTLHQTPALVIYRTSSPAIVISDQVWAK